ncbi:hypothetical protein EDD36DRAFT_121037 [Exophiala viscosa]|uniref:Uncharacterized protein n=1 Tax=Exophiala viscosa TaxID=2486360 RepID=A0AAN6II09_9EURO|nr:hypothetical protein EDD36DRAFT_121037 [Exophiala viscosa]
MKQGTSQKQKGQKTARNPPARPGGISLAISCTRETPTPNRHDQQVPGSQVPSAHLFYFLFCLLGGTPGPAGLSLPAAKLLLRPRAQHTALTPQPQTCPQHSRPPKSTPGTPKLGLHSFHSTLPHFCALQPTVHTHTHLSVQLSSGCSPLLNILCN